MELNELKALWTAGDEKISSSETMDALLIAKQHKIKSELNTFKAMTWIGILSGMAWVYFLGYLIFQFHQSIFFVVSISAILFFPLLALFAYIRQLNFFQNFNYSGSVVSTQQQLSNLYLMVTRNIRIQFLQIPFYTTFYLSIDMLRQANPVWLGIQIVATTLSILLAICLYREVKVENLHKKWVKKLVDGVGGKSIQQSIEFLGELEHFEAK